MDWKLLKSEYVYRHEPWLTLRKDTCEMPGGKIIDPYFVLEYPDFVTAVAITAEGQVVLVKQYRHALGKTVLEVPGGAMDKTDPDPAFAIRRELLEETGYAFSELFSLGAVSHNPASANNMTHLFLATGGIKVQEQHFDEGEEIELEYMDVEELEEALRQNRFVQALHVSCIYYALLKYQELHSPFQGDNIK